MHMHLGACVMEMCGGAFGHLCFYISFISERVIMINQALQCEIRLSVWSAMSVLFVTEGWL